MVLGSSESGGCARRGSPENPAARAALVLRKLLRPGKHSDGNMVVSVHRRAGADYWNEQADDTAERVIGQECILARQSPRRDGLFAGEAIEVGHLTLHFLAGGVGGGANALDAQLEFIGVGGASQSFVKSDELLGVKIEERLIERLHTVLAGAGGDSVMNQARFVRVDDAIADVAGGDHDFNGRNAALVIGAANEALRDDGLQRG